MLILTRRIGETIVIGDDIKVNVLGIKGGQVRIGIDAPKDVSVHRSEIADRISAGLEKGEKPSETEKPIQYEAALDLLIDKPKKVGDLKERNQVIVQIRDWLDIAGKDIGVKVIGDLNYRNIMRGRILEFTLDELNIINLNISNYLGK